MTTKTAFGILGVLFVAGVAARAQAPATVNTGVYTAEQAKRGAPLYAENCATCHGEELQGADPNPPLAGKIFAERWTNLGEWFDKTATSMPAMAPGSLTGKEVAEVLAYTLQMSKYPAGSTELPSTFEALSLIKVEPAK